MPTIQHRTSRSYPARIVVLTVLTTALIFGLAACGGSSKSSSAPAEITIKNSVFSTTPVAAGTTVTIRNDDPTNHSVTANDGKSFNVTVLAGHTATFVAPVAGTYKFYCNLHLYMHGVLTVT